MNLFYFRKSENTLFIFPALAIGSEHGIPFIEVAWLCWAVGVGDAG